MGCDGSYSKHNGEAKLDFQMNPDMFRADCDNEPFQQHPELRKMTDDDRVRCLSDWGASCKRDKEPKPVGWVWTDESVTDFTSWAPGQPQGIPAIDERQEFQSGDGALGYQSSYGGAVRYCSYPTDCVDIGTQAVFSCVVGQEIYAEVDGYSYGSTIISINSDTQTVIVDWDYGRDTISREIHFSQTKDKLGAPCIPGELNQLSNQFPSHSIWKASISAYYTSM
jgi:hypothetical protein